MGQVVAICHRAVSIRLKAFCIFCLLSLPTLLNIVNIFVCVIHHSVKILVYLFIYSGLFIPIFCSFKQYCNNLFFYFKDFYLFDATEPTPGIIFLVSYLLGGTHLEKQSKLPHHFKSWVSFICLLA